MRHFAASIGRMNSQAVRIRCVILAQEWSHRNSRSPRIDHPSSVVPRACIPQLGTRHSPARFAEGFDPDLPPIAQPRVLIADLNGDEDLYLPNTQESCLIERSFLRYGYAPGKIIGAERNPSEKQCP